MFRVGGWHYSDLIVFYFNRHRCSAFMFRYYYRWYLKTNFEVQILLIGTENYYSSGGFTVTYNSHHSDRNDKMVSVIIDFRICKCVFLYFYVGRIKTCLDAFQSGNEPKYHIGLIIGFFVCGLWLGALECVWIGSIASTVLWQIQMNAYCRLWILSCLTLVFSVSSL